MIEGDHGTALQTSVVPYDSHRVPIRSVFFVTYSTVADVRDLFVFHETERFEKVDVRLVAVDGVYVQILDDERDDFGDADVDAEYQMASNASVQRGQGHARLRQLVMMTRALPTLIVPHIVFAIWK